LEGSGGGLIETVSEKCSGGPEENHENLSQNLPYPGRYLIQAPPEYKLRALLLNEHVRHSNDYKRFMIEYISAS
jgi:hypothetical protein